MGEQIGKLLMPEIAIGRIQKQQTTALALSGRLTGDQLIGKIKLEEVTAHRQGNNQSKRQNLYQGARV